MLVFRQWYLACLSALLGLFAAPAFAAVPEGVTDAITDAGADAVVIAGAVLVVIIGLLAFKLMRRAAH